MARGSRDAIGLGRSVLGALVLGIALLASGCSTLLDPSSGDLPPEQRAAYDAAMGRLPADARGASQALEAFVDTFPRSRLADDAFEQLARLAFADGRLEQGMRWLGKILSRYPNGDRAAAARLRLARVDYSRDKRAAARRWIGPLDLDRLSLTDRRAAFRLRVVLARTPAERLENLTLLRATLVAETVERADDRNAVSRLETRIGAVDEDIEELIERGAITELEEIVRSLRGRPPAGAISLELSRRALDAGQLDLAARRLEVTAELVQGDLEQVELAVLGERLARRLAIAEAEAELPPLRELVGRPRPRTDDARGTIGAVLPLSGDFAYYGEESLRGILLAADLFADSDAEALRAGYVDVDLRPGSERRSEIRLIVHDSEGDPVRAAEAVRELARDSELVAVVGPIFSQESLAAAQAAEEVGVPLITLSTRTDVPIDRDQVFRTRTTPADEVAVLVGHAFEVLGAERFAVLYPQNRYGRGMRKLYWDAVTERGGKMVAASSYASEAVDFSTAIRNMIGYRFLTHWEKKALEERSVILRAARRLEPEEAGLLREAAYSILGPELEPLPPIVDFDVLFIPDAADKIVLIAPGLAFHEIVEVGLLGSSEWLDEELLRVSRRHVSGAVISSPFHAESDLPFVVEFVEGYRNTFGSEPSAFAAEAFDAANLVLAQLSAGRGDRDGVRAGLLDVRAYPGATGVLTIQPDGNARRRPFLLRVSGRRFRPLD